MILKATIAMLLALACALGAKRASAATRHAILAAGQLAALAVPLLALIVPPVAVTVVQPPLAPAPSLAPLLLPLAWLAGCAVVAALRARSLVKAAGIARRARSWNGVYVSGEIDQPMTFGARILLPTEALRWDAAQREIILLHERAHVERRDSLLGLAGDAACAVYWFHPLAWVLARRARLERERACDEAVLARGVRGSDYAAVLVAVARGAAAHAHGLPIAPRASELELRIRGVLRGDAKRPARAARAAVAAAALVVAPLVSAVTPFVLSRPVAGEPDLLGDAVASPESERLDEWRRAPVSERQVRGATGHDDAVIATLQTLAKQEHRSALDLVPERARWALARVHGGRLVEPLLESLGDADWRVRAYAAWALGVARDRRATAPLAAQLRDPIWRMRAMAAYALAASADPAAHAAMRDALADRAWQVRVEAVRYLAAVGDPSDRRLLRAMCGDRHMAVRAAAVEALP